MRRTSHSLQRAIERERLLKLKRRRPMMITAMIAGACFVLLFGALSASINTKPVMPPSVAREHMERWLIEDARRVAGEVRLKHIRALEPFYLARDYQPVWLDNYELTPAARELIQALKETSADDWQRYDYALHVLLREVHQLSNTPERATAIDVLLTDAWMTYTKQVLNQQLVPDTNENDHPVRRVSSSDSDPRITDESVLNLLNDALQQRELPVLMEELVPQHRGYMALRKELNRYLELANRGDWQPLPVPLELQPGDRHPAVPVLRNMLVQYGDLESSAFQWLIDSRSETGSDASTPADEELLFDEPLSRALMHFQQRYGLEPSGRVDAETLSWLNLTPYQVAQKIALNMKRWRHLPADLGQRHVMVNMADYKLQYVEDGDVELEMKVIIGKLSRRTPVMTHRISQMELAPTWVVPYRIATQYLLPKFRRKPEYIRDKGFQIVERVDGQDQFVNPDDIDWHQVSRRNFPYRIIQKAGGANALGSVKFLFPNPQSIYLHDTSQPELFSLDGRALSSGCVRVEKPMELAEVLLKGQLGWSRQRVEETIAQNRTTRLRLSNPVPVHLMYWTAWVNQDGQLQIRDDVYRRDIIAGIATGPRDISF
ncbi:L,D-transpeptidase family protein [Oceanobacter kriegii]|uniref:L,D-transpeptidase family protein n=1 Tax=Oceanobacter kriegii TaxID=64972 RepID=UPI000A05D2B5|nr:L,D-transpeptidase family protein [Oceanobacter kriegii]